MGRPPPPSMGATDFVLIALGLAWLLWAVFKTQPRNEDNVGGVVQPAHNLGDMEGQGPGEEDQQPEAAPGANAAPVPVLDIVAAHHQDIKDEVFKHMSLCELRLVSGTDIRLYTALKQRTKRLTINLSRTALTLVPEPILLTASRLFHRGYQGWAAPPPGSIFQDPSNILLEGDGSHLPLPHARFIIGPDGALTPYDVVEPQPRHAYTTSGFFSEYETHDSMLHQALFLRINIFLDQGSRIDIEIRRRFLANPGQVTIVLEPNDVATYPALCGAVLWVVSSAHSPMARIPKMFQESRVLVVLATQTHLGQNARLTFPPAIREAIALMMLRLREPDAVPDAELKYLGTGPALHLCPLQHVLYD